MAATARQYWPAAGPNSKLSLKRLSLALLALFLLSCCERRSQSGLGPGETPPQIKLYTLDGVERSLGDFKGKIVLLNFWASWCPPCIEELPELEKLHLSLNELGFTVVAIAVEDSESELRKVQERFKLSFPILKDREGASKKAFRVAGLPESFVIDREGKFLMLPDPSDSSPVVRIIGPRNWGSEEVLALFRNLTKE